MRGMARLVLASIAMIMVIAIGIGDIAIPTVQAYDPPSIFNTGGGGYSGVYSILRGLGYRVDSTEDLRSLDRYSPASWVLVIAGPDEELSRDDVIMLSRWISSGGRVIALDEIGSLSPLLRIANASLTKILRSTDLFRCGVGGNGYDVLYNVYAVIDVKPGSGVESLCTARGLLIAIRVKIQGGDLIYISDSSIVINNILGSRFGGDNLGFFLDLLDRKQVLFYEGGRYMLVLRTSYLLSALMMIPAVLSYITDQIVSSGAPGVLVLLLISIMITAIFVTTIPAGRIIEQPRIPGRTRKRSINIDAAEMIVKGAEKWRRLKGRG